MVRYFLIVATLVACKKTEAPTQTSSPGSAAPAIADAATPAIDAMAAIPTEETEATTATAVPSAGEFCKQQTKAGNVEGCDIKAPDKQATAVAPFKSVLLTWSGPEEGGMATDKEHHLLLQTDKGWFVHSFERMSERGDNETTVDALSVEDFVVGGGTEVVVRYTSEGVQAADGAKFARKGLFVCGVGTSGTPSCSDPIVVSERVTGEGGGGKALSDWSIDLKVTADTLHRSPTAGSPPEDATGALRIKFP